MKRFHQGILIVSTVLGSWLGMQDVHEFGHVLGAWLTGARVEKVVLNPLTFSRTDLAHNPSPLLVVWAGPVVGILLPLICWAIAAGLRMPGAFFLRFFTGFCLIANGAYIAGGSFDGIGDCGQMLRHGSPMWQLWLFGLVTVPIGLWLCHRLGPHFGVGPAQEQPEQVRPGVAYASLIMFVILLILGFGVDGD